MDVLLYVLVLQDMRAAKLRRGCAVELSHTGNQAVNLFDGITTEFLSGASRKHGLGTTQTAMMPAPTLVEAAAMAHTLDLLFHTAAVKHFAAHEPHEGRSVPAHPRLLVDRPRPGTLRPIRPFALRFPLTTPLRDNAGPEALLFWTNGRDGGIEVSTAWLVMPLCAPDSLNAVLLPALAAAVSPDCLALSRRDVDGRG